MIIKKILTSIFIINFSYISVLTSNAHALASTKIDPGTAIIQKSENISNNTKFINLKTADAKSKTFFGESEYEKNKIKNKVQTVERGLRAASSLMLVTIIILFGFIIKMGLKQAKKMPQKG